MPVRHPFLEHDGPIPFVHRGGALEAFENTTAAFEVALSVGFTYFETDVRATADGVLLSFHDATLSRVTDRDGRISELPWDEVAQAVLFLAQNGYVTGQTIHVNGGWYMS